MSKNRVERKKTTGVDESQRSEYKKRREESGVKSKWRRLQENGTDNKGGADEPRRDSMRLLESGGEQIVWHLGLHRVCRHALEPAEEAQVLFDGERVEQHVMLRADPEASLRPLDVCSHVVPVHNLHESAVAASEST